MVDRPPKYLTDLWSVYDREAYHNAVEWFGKHGIVIGYSTIRRSWFMQRPGVITLWCGLGTFIERLDAPSQTLKEFYDQDKSNNGGTTAGMA